MEEKPEKVVARRFDEIFSNVVVEKEVDERFKRWGSIGGREGVVGYKVIKHKEGHRLDSLQDREYMVVYRPYDILYRHSYGEVSRFFRGLLEKKIYGTKCTKCGEVFCPPRKHCWNPSCRLQETEWIEMPHRGILHSYTILGFAAESFLPRLPFLLGYVRLEGANTMLAMVVDYDKPEEMECDTPVEVKFVDEPKGSPMDLYAVPTDKPKCRRTDEEKERIRQQLEPIRAWVKKRFG